MTWEYWFSLGIHLQNTAHISENLIATTIFLKYVNCNACTLNIIYFSSTSFLYDTVWCDLIEFMNV